MSLVSIFGIEPDDKMAQSNRMSQRDGRKLQAGVPDKMIQLEQSIYGSHGTTFLIEAAISERHPI
jgi:hypothetical protein